MRKHSSGCFGVIFFWVIFFWIIFFWIIFFWIIFVGAGVDCDGRIREWGIEEAPGFAVDFEAHLFGGAVGIETEHGLGRADFYGDDVPDIQGDYVGGDEVDVELGVGDVASGEFVGGAGFVGAGAEGVGALDLDAEELRLLRRVWGGGLGKFGTEVGWAAIVEDEVVAFTVSP